MRNAPTSLATIIGTCPGLSVGDDGLVWTDSLGRSHLLARAVRLSIGAVASRLGRDERTVLRRVEAREIYPVLRHSSRDIEVYEVAVEDYLNRATLRGAEGKGATHA